MDWKSIISLTKNNSISNRFAAPAPAGITYTNSTGRHTGVDMVLKNDRIPSFSDGTVIKTVTGNTGYGNYVVVKDSRGFYNYYAHLNSISVVPGQTVKEGDILGIQGSSGNSNGKHLHLEIRRDMNDAKTAIDPSSYFLDNTKETSWKNWMNNLNDKITQSELAGRVPWATPAEKANSGYTILGFLGHISTALIIRIIFILTGIFLLYVAITRGMFGDRG